MNIKEGALYADHKVEPYAELINEYAPDVVCLQEVDHFTKRNGNTDFLNALAQATGMFPYWCKSFTYQAGGFGVTPEKIICGGPMMGFGMFQLDVPTTKTSTALLAFQRDDVSRAKPTACINCGRCVEVCPGRVVPSKLADYAEHFDEEAFLENYGMECCECGCCSYVCPAKRPLTQEIKSMRKLQLAKRKK